MKKFSSLVLILLFFYNSYGKTITIAVSANAEYAIKEIASIFEKKYNIKVSEIVSSSGKLANQIIRGAPFDIFISADMKYPQFLYKKGFALEKPKIYAYGIVVLWTMKNIPLKSVKVLTKDNIKRIAVPNPKLAPYGKASIEILKNYKIYQKVKNKLIYGESVSQASLYIYKGLADAGFTAKSIVLAPKFKNKGNWIEIDRTKYKPIAQGVVLLRKNGKLFYQFLFTKESKEILKKYGYQINE
ncbi:molybdate ABC transporter substrate-binding protein [Hydrogenothermus marinus]|uniref:Molybdate transport system substrate-binding protein n=1 Tax=Hydrogenothermus marinus TaxID=133270 RepID=A0A3M0BKM8_9AQUI|nr:molybdate ABC transporter substrate-binding protein [Hydrogenothermus marinus]RMA97910.1 molybdate transport system substrate-binding protein [Hydrogenothermus marinus]